MARSGFRPLEEIRTHTDDLDIRLPAHRVHGQDRAPGQAHDGYTPRQDEGRAFGFVRHDRNYDETDWYGRRGLPASPGFPPGGTADGGFRGLGPRGYRRSDSQIREDVCDRLTEDDAIDARGISVTAAQGEVVLEGRVGSHRMRRAAEVLPASAAGRTAAGPAFPDCDPAGLVYHICGDPW